jgi:hypothetical protein
MGENTHTRFMTQVTHRDVVAEQLMWRDGNSSNVTSQSQYQICQMIIC